MSRHSSYSGASYLGAMVGGWILGWFSGAVRAAVAMKAWEWFVTDTFGAPSLGFIEAWGLFLLVSFATATLDTKLDGRPPAELAVTGFFLSLLFSGVAFASLLILAGLR